MTVLGRVENSVKKVKWKCRCDCGNETIVLGGSLRKGTTQSCGCYWRERIVECGFKHGYALPKYKHLRNIHRGILSRCRDPKNNQYSNYGGRGIKICEEWLSLKNFGDWAISHGYAENLQIDRIDNDGNYEPSNCRFVTPFVNSNNRRNTCYVEIDGEKLPLRFAAKKYNCPWWRIVNRMNAGYSGMNLVKEKLMKGKLILSVEQADNDKNAWLEVRKSGIGGSEIGIIYGLNPWKSAYALYCEKVGLVEQEDISDKGYVELGNYLEPYVADKFTKATGIKLRRCGTLADEEYPFLHANVDRLCIGQSAGLEIKTASRFKKEEWVDDQLPDSYYLQIQYYLMITGLEKWYVAALFRDDGDFIWKEIPRNESVIQEVREKAVDFWENHVLAKVPPEVDGSESSTEALKKAYPSSNGMEIALPSQANELFARLDELDKALALVKEQQEQAKNQLKLMLGDNEIGVIGDRKVTWKTQKARATIDSKKLQKEYAEAYQACVKYGEPSRVMRIK